jgi:phosphate-selective porin
VSVKRSILALGLLAAIPNVNAAEADVELYVDQKTRQIFAEPAPGRARLGSFRKVEDSAAGAAAASPAQRDGRPAPATIATSTARVAAVSPPAGQWYERLKMRGYVQMRYNQVLSGDEANLATPGDRFLGANQSFGLRRVRLVISGQVSERLFVYLQPDFGSTPSGSSTSNFGQIRDAYADISLDPAHEWRVRAGQSKVPYGFENLQSSQNRLAPDRADALNSGVRDERDVGLFFYYSPKVAAQRFGELTKSGLKGSGDYGVLGLGAYNGQGANRSEGNNRRHVVLHATWPFKLASGQFFQVGADAYVGQYRVGAPTSIKIDGTSFTPVVDAGPQGSTDRRVAAHVIWYPQPFGLQAEWTVGEGPQLDVAGQRIRTRSLRGGYVQAMLRKKGAYGVLTPYVKWQTYKGAAKFDTNAPRMLLDEVEAGVEWQPSKALEILLAYARMDRTNTRKTPYDRVRADVARVQLQWNF